MYEAHRFLKMFPGRGEFKWVKTSDGIRPAVAWLLSLTHAWVML